MILRADAGERIGTGHVFRCLALALCAAERGLRPRLVTGSIPRSLRERFERRGIPVDDLDEDAGSDRDVDKTSSLCEQHGSTWVVLDGYQFDRAYQRRLVQRSPGSLMVVDDYGHLEQYHCRVLLNQNLHAERSMYRDRIKSQPCRLLLGTEHVLLRPEFRELNPRPPQIQPRVQNLLISLGGSDSGDVSRKILRSLAEMNTGRNLNVKLIAGALYRHAEELVRRANEWPFHLSVEIDVDRMVPHMQWADAAIASASSTVWELCYLGVPMALVICADNQEPIARSMQDRGAAISLGWVGDRSSRAIADRLEPFLCRRSLRENLSDRSFSLVDGRGAQRCLDSLEELLA